MIIVPIVLGVCILLGGGILIFGIRHAPVGEETPEGFREVPFAIGNGIRGGVKCRAKGLHRKGQLRLTKTNASVSPFGL